MVADIERVIHIPHSRSAAMLIIIRWNSRIADNSELWYSFCKWESAKRFLEYILQDTKLAPQVSSI